ncbi:phosphatases II [Tilletiaria anomala UBC 951]|uniref:protein-tyrosine-phosphatase n=1 Tax=Tilletiaria anomala (strain ATCC 24038 / CBS 436.72 / UBC 951) TaxID=1037660 RepID=A0A066W2K7_TILAU|nr:phosphatases II [Tilletiaria anomala UBC 951]KDN48207.1 phosphatases II [Tilletiaria anomala UBC 951]
MGKGGFEVQKYEYARFYDDWGPLNMAMVWMFCDDVERLMDRPDLREHGIVLYTSSAPRRKTNAATLAALRSVLVYHLAPHDAFHPFSTLDVQPFRDAGYGRSDFFLSIQDVLYGAWRAQTLGFADLATFDVDEYLYSEQPQNGDWNWITPSFIAFASPNDPSYGLEAQTSPARSTKAKANSVAGARAFHQRKQNLLSDFRKRNVQLVVRLNNPLYDKDIFEDVGIAHIDLYFDDGSNPSTAILREFIQRADAVVERGGVVAVHCKAGLGRTGVLIGAYLIWKYGFNAPEAIAWMRVQRPGCVVGPQQQFVYEQCIDWVRPDISSPTRTRRL